MIGVLDSGRGGLVAYKELRRLMPRADITYLADRKNAPYGNKSPGEILHLTERGIRRLWDMGCEIILIACCTASSLHEMLPEELKKVSIPIITPTARLCEGSRSVLVIATEHTARSRAFSREIKRFSDASVREIPMQPLVDLIEWGRDTRSAVERIIKMCEGYDTLILGCTHFSHLLGDLRERLPEVKILSPAHIGASEITRFTIDHGYGRNRYTS
ncbi:MAG: aspartate/glutamate racemase family protein [Clostridia bacterium]|nr:aspartate/glutamate racemase family protein [Clostridia bacterium]